MIGTPASSRPWASLSGVCPPNCTITPKGFSRATISSTSSRVSDSKYSRSEEHTSELQSLMRISYAVFCLTKKKRLKQLRSSRRVINEKITDLDAHRLREHTLTGLVQLQL